MTDETRTDGEVPATRAAEASDTVDVQSESAPKPGWFGRTRAWFGRWFGWLRPDKFTRPPGTGTEPWHTEMDELRTALIEQEHRAPQVYWRAVESFGWEKGDPRRDAARRAVVWRIFAPATLAIGGAGLFTMLTYCELRTQNGFIQAQVDLQSQQYISTQRASLVATLYEMRECDVSKSALPPAPKRAGNVFDEVAFSPPKRPRVCPAFSPRAREEAVRALSEIERGEGRMLNLTEVSLQGGSLSGSYFSDASFHSAYLVDADLQKLYATNVDFGMADLRRATITGVLVDPNLNAAILANADMRDVAIFGLRRDAQFIATDLTRADMRDVSLFRGLFVQAAMDDVDLRGADFVLADMTMASLRRAKLAGTNLRSADLEGVKLEGCHYCPPKTQYETLWPPNFKGHHSACRIVMRECSDGDKSPYTEADVIDEVFREWDSLSRAAEDKDWKMSDSLQVVDVRFHLPYSRGCDGSVRSVAPGVHDVFITVEIDSQEGGSNWFVKARGSVHDPIEILVGRERLVEPVFVSSVTADSCP